MNLEKIELILKYPETEACKILNSRTLRTHSVKIHSILCRATLIVALLLLSIEGVWGQKTWDGGGDGTNWSSANNWNPNGVPLSNQTVTISRNASTIINVNGDYTCAGLTIELYGNDNGNRTLQVNVLSGNSLTVNGIIDIDNISTRFARTKTCYINVIGVLNANGGISMTSTSGNDNKVSSLRISGGTVNVDGDIVMNTVAPRNDITFADGSLFVSGTISGGTINAGTGTVDYNGTIPQNIGTYSYYNLTISGSGNKTSSSTAFSAANNLFINSGNLVLQATDANYTIGNNLSVATGATLTHSVSWDGSGKLLDVGGNLTIAGTYNYLAAGRAHVQMTGSGTRDISTGSTAMSILTLQNGNFRATGPLTVNDNFWAMFGTPGSFSTNGQTVNANASLFINDGSVSINGGTLNVTGGVTVGMGSAGIVSMTSGTLNTDNLLINPSSSYICSGSPQINIKGDYTNSGTFSGGSSNISLTGTANQNIDGFTTLGTVDMTKTAGTATLRGNVIGSGLTVNGAGGTINLGAELTHSFSGLFTMSNGTINGGSSTLRLGGVVNASGGTFIPGTGTVEFYGGVQSVPGVTYNNLTISGGNTKTLNNNARVNGTLNLNSGILSLGSYDLVLGTGASVSGTFSSNSMINVGNRSVIKEGNINTDFIIQLPIGIGTTYTPVNISNFSATISPASRVSVRSEAIAAPGVTGIRPLNRHWITSTTGISGSVLADISFQYDASDIPSGGNQSLYEIFYKPTSGAWANPGGASAAGVNPLRASAANSLDATWTASEPVNRVFYSFKSGNWNDATTWTLDPSGTQWLNPNLYTPANSPTAAFDEVIILSGRFVNVTNNSMSNKDLTVNGTLDLGETTGHSFTTISGTGRIRLAGDNFPEGNASIFISEGQGEGTVEFYGNTRNLTNNRTFYNVEVNLSSGQTLNVMSNYTINRDLTIKNGIFSINNNSSSTPRDITVFGNVFVETSGKIATGTGNARHQLNLYGDFINNGESRFTNRVTPIYTSEASDGIVDVNFLNSARNQSILCNGITNFYRIEIDKGTDFTYILNIDATNADFFKLFGYANEGHGSVLQLPANNNALGLLRGTVRIGNNINIPVLSQNSSNYNISESAQLWIDGGSVSKSTGTAIVVYGKIRITHGTLEALINSGITFRENGMVSVEGGTINANQIRTTTEGSSTYGGYVQTGGVVNVLGGTVNSDFYVFSLPFASSVFNMSGGTLKVNTSSSNGAILINSAPENIKVTGGTVIAETQSDRDFRITSTAPFWNLELQNPTSVARQFILTDADNIGPADIDVPVQPLKVLNDFRIWGKESGGASYAGIIFNPGINDVYIGGSFFIEDGARYIPISGGTAPYDAISNQPTSRNTTFLNQTTGTGNVEEIYQGNASAPLEFGNLVIDRTNGYEVRLTSAAARANESVVIDINGNASVLSGTLNQNLFTIRTWGAIINNDRMGTWYPGVTPSRAQIQFVENPALTLSTAADAVFGNVQVNVTPPSLLTLTSNVFIERLEYVKGLIYLKNYNLKIDNLWNLETGIFQDVPATSFLKVLNNGYSGSSMIFTDGKGSDGGLTIRVGANSQAENENNILNNFGPMTFPIGFTSDAGTTLYFRPAQVVVKNFSDPGYITIRPVMGVLPTTNQSGGQVLQHYWRVSHNGFSNLPTVSYRFYYRNQTGVSNVDLSTTLNETSFVPGKVLDENPYTRQYESGNDIFRGLIDANSRAITINGTSTGALFSPSSEGIILQNANYTAGVTNRFTGNVLIYYSRDNQQQANWNNPASWTNSNILNPIYAPHDSRQPASATYPGAGDVAVIGWIPWTDLGRTADLRGMPHSIWIGNYSQQAAEVVFTKMTDASGNPVARKYRSNFQFRPTLCIDQPAGQLVTKLVKGEGSFWNRQSDPDYTQMDIGDFAREDSSYVIYENFTNGRIINNTPPLFPNIYISNDNWGANDHNFTFSRDIETTGNIELLGNVNLTLPTGATGNLTAGRNLIMFENAGSGGGARIDFGNSGTARRVIIKGNLVMRNANSIIRVEAPDASIVDHELHIYGNIIQGTSGLSALGLNLYTSATTDRITLFLDGNQSMTYNLINGTIPELYRLIINKGSSIATTAQFNCDFNLNGVTSGVGIPKALELRNGLFIVNNPGVDLYLTTGNDHFSIPSTAGLEMRLGRALANGGSGIALDGLLRLSGGDINLSGGDNPIEYSASGNATISITDGTLTVGGQVRRSLTSDVGILNYSQSGGTVIVGNNSATVGHRGVFEILNPGSSFTMTGGDLFIARAQASPSISAFYFDPSDYNISSSANIHIGHSTTPANQILGIYAVKPLPRLRINNSGTAAPKVTARLEIVPATISSMLQIDAGTSFNANGLNLTLSGDMIASGTYVPGGNTTFFNGSGVQTITGNGDELNLYNLEKTGSDNLRLNSGNTPLRITNSISLHNGTFTDNGNTITVKGNILNNAVHENSGTGDGIVMNGDFAQVLSGNGTFGKLTINNPMGVNVPVGNEFIITRSLKMQSGVFNIGSNLLSLGVDAVIEEASPFSSVNMIETNLSFTDNGLKKTFRAGSSPIFTFPIGSNSKYTPVTLTISSNGNSTGSITVRPANEIHPGIVEDTEDPGPQIVDKENALQHYWSLRAEGITGFSAEARMYFLDSDVKVTSPYSVSDYHPASLLSGGAGTWLKFPKSDFDAVNKRIEFSFTDTDDSQVSGDYTAGAGNEDLVGAIPSIVTMYETTGSGNWVTDPIWTPNVSGGPGGAIIRINAAHTVDVTSNYRSVYKSEIFGTLNLGTTFGNRLGVVDGTGTIYLQTGDLPAAIYYNFFQPAGGTLEFGGSTNYEFLGNITGINHLKLSGSGQRKFPNNNLTLNGNLTIDGVSELQVINYFNRTIYLKGNLSRISGSFDAGTGPNAIVSLKGSVPQFITGSFTDNNAFNILEVNNGNNITLEDEVEIDRELLLLNGLVNTGPSGLLRMNFNSTVNPAAGTNLSFVNGTLIKELLNGNSFTFAIGSIDGSTKNHGPARIMSIAGPSGIHDWSATYYYNNAASEGFDTESFQTPVSTVSKSEYWKMEGPAGGSARISFILDGSSDVANSLTDLSNLRIVGWNAIGGEWEIVGAGANVTGTSTSGTITTTSPVVFNNYTYFTLASVIPVIASTATIASQASVVICSGSSTTITVAFTGEMPYVLTYTVNGTSVTTPAINTSTYDINVTPAANTTYTLTGMTANGATGMITGTSAVTVTVSALPTVVLSRSGSGAICQNTSITFTATSGLSNYNFRVNNITVQNGPSNIYTTNSLVTSTVDVVGTNAAGCSATSNPVGVTVNPLPDAAGPISGAASVCRGSSSAYSIPVIPNATSYSWSATNGATISGAGTTTKTISFPNSGTCTITVRGVNACGNGTPSTFVVAVSTSGIPGAAGSITGPAQVCRGGSGYTYSVSPVANATSYIWQYTGTGATINGTGNSVTVDFAPGATGGNLRVAGTNGCATGTYSPVFAINVNQPPTATINPATPSICSGSALSLTALPTGGTAPYTTHSWTGTGAGSLSSVSIPNPIFSNTTGGSYDLTYTVTDTRGCTGSVNTTVFVFQAPIANAGADITGLCSGTTPIAMSGASAGGSYSGTPVWSGSGGTWTQNPDPSLATFTPSAPVGSTVATLTLIGANGCSNVTDTRLISWNSIPGQPGNFTVSNSIVCQGQAGIVYTIPNNPTAISYNWSYTIGSGVTINGSGTSVTVDFSATATSGSLNVSSTNACGTSSPRSIAIIVNTAPVATFNYTANPYCPTGSDPLPVFTGGGVAGTFTANPAGLVFVNALTGQVDLSASIPGVYEVTNTIAAEGGCGIVTATSTLEITKDYVWTGSLGTSWNAAGNWSCSTVPAAINSITIPSTATNMPVIGSGSSGFVNNLTIQSGASLTLSGALEISGTITNTGGTIFASNGEIVMNGTAPQSIGTGVFADNTVKDLTVDNSSGVTLSGPLKLNGILLLRNGDLDSDGNLTLLSTSTGTAFIDGTGNGDVIGNVTMQRYLEKGFGYKYISSPFKNSKVSELSQEINLGYWFPLIYAFDENRNDPGPPIIPLDPFYKYVDPGYTLKPLEGYAVQFGNSESPVTVEITGEVNNGSITRELTNHNHPYSLRRSLVGNPYPSAIDWTAATGWTKTNIDGAIHYFSASTVDEWEGSYVSWVNGEAVDGIASNIIPSMQGFMVTVSPGFATGTLSMNNDVRVKDMTKVFAKKSSNNTSDIISRPRLRLIASYADQYPKGDPMLIYHEEKATNNYDSQLDAFKYMNTDHTVPNIFSIGVDKSMLSINAIPFFDDILPTIPLGVVLDSEGEIIFRLKDIEQPYFWGKVSLYDSINKVSVELSGGEEYRIFLTSGEYFDRFYLNFEHLITGEDDLVTEIDPFKAFSYHGLIVAEILLLPADKGILTIHNFTGQKLYESKVYSPGRYEMYPGLKDGIYIITLTSGNMRISKKIFISNR